MTSLDFALWLKGFFANSGKKTLDAKQVNDIKKHLDLVFVHEIDSSARDKKLQKVKEDVEYLKRRNQPMRC